LCSFAGLHPLEACWNLGLLLAQQHLDAVMDPWDGTSAVEPTQADTGQYWELDTATSSHPHSRLQTTARMVKAQRHERYSPGHPSSEEPEQLL
jgi:hypothetical protein